MGGRPGYGLGAEQHSCGRRQQQFLFVSPAIQNDELEPCPDRFFFTPSVIQWSFWRKKKLFFCCGFLCSV
jgi:hypothetical protein